MSKTINYKESAGDVVDTVALSLASFKQAVLNELGNNANVIYDPELSYRTAIESLRADEDFQQSGKNVFPLIVYKRSPLRYVEDGKAPNKRMTTHKNKLTLSDGNVAVYTGLHAEYTIDWLFISNSQQDIERFEVAYLSEEGLSAIKELEVNMRDNIGDFTYHMTWNDELSDLEINDRDDSYKLLIGSCVVRGYYFTFRSESSIIKTINYNTHTYLNSPFDGTKISEKTITG